MNETSAQTRPNQTPMPTDILLICWRKKTQIAFVFYFNFFLPTRSDHVTPPRDIYRERTPQQPSPAERTKQVGKEFQNFSFFFALRVGRNLFLLFLAAADECVPLLRDSLLSPLPGRLGLRTLRVHLLLQDTFAGFLGLRLMDLFTGTVSHPIHSSTHPLTPSRRSQLTCSINALLCLKVLPLLRWYSSWYRCLSILPDARYLTRRRRRTRRRRIHRTWLGMRASLVPFLFPKPV